MDSTQRTHFNNTQQHHNSLIKLQDFTDNNKQHLDCLTFDGPTKTFLCQPASVILGEANLEDLGDVKNPLNPSNVNHHLNLYLIKLLI